MKLSVITLTYNKLKYTKKYIESLYKYTRDFELIIVDNGSTDGTVEYLKTLDGVKLILNSENLGFSKGNNQGIEIAEGEFIGFLNNDILLYPNWFEEVEHVFEKENAAFVSSREINSVLQSKSDYEKNFDKCQFSCVITKKDVLTKLGGFDENYTPAFFEDNDFKYRAIEAGYDVFVANKSYYFHYGSVTSKKLDYNLAKNRNYYFSKHRFAEYLTQISLERDDCKQIMTDFRKFPLNLIYGMYLLPRKTFNFIKRTMRENF